MLGGLLIAGGGMAVLGVVLATMLAVANKKLAVYEDPRIDAVEQMLPLANCGACGLPGCRAFAEALVAGEASPGQCAPSSEDDVANIAEYLGVHAGTTVKRVAFLACAGGTNVAQKHARYDGIDTCRAAVLIGGGGKGCPWGCLWYGDCAAACPFDAIHIDANSMPVVDTDVCTGCGECVTVCPKNLYSLHEPSHELWVACQSRTMGKTATSWCMVACTGCGLCVKNAAEGLIEMRDNLPVIDYAKNGLAALDAIEKCPTGAIVWLDKDKGAIRGEKAVKALEKKLAPKEEAPAGAES